jgi:uncharacterized membrane protein YfcA
MKARAIYLLLAAVGIGAFAACADSSRVTGPRLTDDRISRDSAEKLLGLFGPTPVYCPSSETVSTTSVVSALGGILSVGGSSISIPAGALLEPVTMTLTVPASLYMEIDISVQGSEHFLFELPATVNLNYSRCSSLRLLLFPAQAWYWDAETRQLLELMPGVDNKLTRTVTFPTIHLSGFIIAN